MASLVRVLIATTEGPLAVERVIRSPLTRSKVFTWNGREPQKTISAGYHEFVRRRVGRIPSLERNQTFRLDISGEIDTGESWQLAVFVAHALLSVDRLAGKEEDDRAGTIIVATGTIDHELAVAEVGNVEDKLRKLFEHARLEHALEHGRRVIVALPDANGADGKSEQEKIRRLGAEVHHVGHVAELLDRLDIILPMRAADPDDQWEGSPFRGLEVFDRRHRKIFCGRGKAREEALQMLRRQDLSGCGFLLIHGSSGVGKSSLARAGLLGDIEQTGSAIDPWRTAIVVPSRGKVSPVSALADALVREIPGLELDHEALEDLMLASPADAATAIARALVDGESARRTRLALLVDQLEELLLWAREQQDPRAVHEREVFAEMLGRLARTRLVWVIATLRSDLLSLIEDSPALSDLARDDRLYRLERPRRGALAEIVRRPADLAGLKFVGHDDDNLPLVDVLTDAASGQKDCLPLLQFALKILYDGDKGRTGTISYAGYQSLGGLENAIGAWADKTVNELGGDASTSRAVDDVILNLGLRGREGDVVVASEVLLDRNFITPARERVIKALDEARLIVLDADAKGQRRTARVAHEALLTHWPRARMLFETHGATLALKEDLERGAKRWKDENRDEAFLIPAGRPLVEAQALLAQGRVALSELSCEHVNASLAARRVAVEGAKARLARDEQKVLSLLEASEFGEAERELERITGYLEGESDLDLRERRARCEDQRRRIHALAEFSRQASEVYSLAGEEDFGRAPRVCEGALAALGVFDDADWWKHLPTQDLAAEQIDDLRQEIYRALLLFTALQLVPGIVSLFPRRQAGPRNRMRAFIVGGIARLIPNAVLAAVIRRGGLGFYRLPTRQDNPQAFAEFGHSLAALEQVRRVEEARASEKGEPCRPSRASHLVRRMAEVLQELAAGPKGRAVDYGRLLAVAAPGIVPEPTNGADYFFIGLFNYFIAKRSEDGTVAKLISLLQPSFPDLDARTPLKTAERLLRAAIALEPRNFWPHWVLGRTLLHGGEFASAELAFNAAIALQPGYARGYEQRALALAHQWTRTGDDRLFARARADSRRAAELAAGDPSVFWPRGELFELLGDTKEALEAYSLWLELEEDIQAKIARGAGVARLHELASGLIKDASARAHRAQAHALLALVHWTWKNHDKAMQAATVALAIDPGHAHALTVTGTVLRESGRPHEALEQALEPALRLEPRNFLALISRARALEDIKTDEAALAAWRDLLERSAGAATHRAPPWMLAQARAAEARLASLGPQRRQRALWPEQAVVS